MSESPPQPLPEQGWKRTVAEIRAARTPRGRARLGACSLEGTRLFERALRLGVSVERAVVEASFLADDSARIAALRAELVNLGCQLVPVPADVMGELTEGRSLGGILGLASLPVAPTLAQVLEQAPRRPTTLLACSGVDDPGNIGALVRTAHASGAAALLAVEACDVFHPKAVRTSMGSVFALPVIQRPELEPLVRELDAAGVRTLGAVSTGGVPLPELSISEAPTAVFLGSEAFGLQPDEQAFLSELVTIPMMPGVDSYSVNAAAAVLLYELGRSRRA